MKKILVLGLFFIALPQTSFALPAGYCQVGCKGDKKVPAFDFAKKFSEKGDPNGGPAKPQTKIPTEEGQAPSKVVETSLLLNELKNAENWSSQECGKSLNDDSWNTIEVVAPCADAREYYDRQAAMVRDQHKKSGAPPPSKENANSLYEQASSPPAQKNLDTQWYCRFYAPGQDTALSNNVCKPGNFKLGKNELVAVGMTSLGCRSLMTPAFIPEIKRTFVSGTIGCRKGMPDGSLAAASERVAFSAWIFGQEISLLKANSGQHAPVHKDVRQISSNIFLGSNLCPQNLTNKKIAYDQTCPAYKVHQGVQQTFTVGPIPVTVEAGAEGEIGITHFARVAPMWANGRANAFANTVGYAKAYVNLGIVKGGAEADLTLLTGAYDVYGFGAAAYLPAQNGKAADFYFSEHISGFNKLSALRGSLAAFAKYPVPKFVGWKWKKFRFTIFTWPGLTTEGYLFNQVAGPLSLTHL
jgi:hypothetical protein